ncbi:hypothetical protein [Bosea sp. NBC_00550]|uniref:hypothetical protein n=1 Tax=Bosea sp. NBC_00550 TaxID=2969621 RepID=UPI00222ED20F|nr:hypothetical protein [Bosea sp. NBC_00550]UZF95725.1 hypothetical protein NWE53_27410 [Bosea sp. NBC_00550]
MAWTVASSPILAQSRAEAGKSPPAKRPPCHFLNMMEKNLSEALKKCSDFAVVFRPEPVASQRSGDLVTAGARSEEFLRLFGQARFAQRFPLDFDDLYPFQWKEDGEALHREPKRAALGGTVRGGLIEDNTDDIGQPTVKSGVVTWAAEPPLVDASDRISGVIGTLAISGTKLALRLLFSPAEGGQSLMMTAKLSGESGAECGVPRMRRTGDRAGEPLDMVGRTQSEGECLFVPSADAQAIKSIAATILRGQWIDVPIRLNGETSYTLTMELAQSGRALLRRALDEWGISQTGFRSDQR